MERGRRRRDGGIWRGGEGEEIEGYRVLEGGRRRYRRKEEMGERRGEEMEERKGIEKEGKKRSKLR